MFRIPLTAWTVAAVLVACAPGPSTPTGTDMAPAPAATVTIQGFAFAPADVTVKVGESIRWTNQDSAPHTATADDGSFGTATLGQGRSDSVTFTKVGTYAYHCAVHPTMTAVVHVVAGASESTPPTKSY
ncbi:plastocyanin/azurin family copper-binding protein [Deinococcus sp. KSM4-11]|uniref:plastocyanin/azurin family copper-binding protein n=1 Tax=Deinococcus sp. KSM4-11 TaxID=2568654 RepID=UPI002104A229|nr:plastocyanin/azurin family copper-binding protein [Deinococcus sp. KSM4-11]